MIVLIVIIASVGGYVLVYDHYAIGYSTCSLIGFPVGPMGTIMGKSDLNGETGGGNKRRFSYVFSALYSSEVATLAMYYLRHLRILTHEPRYGSTIYQIYPEAQPTRLCIRARLPKPD